MRTPEKRLRGDGTAGWQVRFRDGTSPKTGKPRQTSEMFDTYADALRFATLIIDMSPTDALSQMDLEAGRHSGPTLDALAEQFFTWKAPRVRSDRTVSDYRRDYRLWLKPSLGQRQASSITEADVQRLVDSMLGALSPKSVTDRHALLHGIYKWAAAPSRRIVLSNPCIGTELPKRAKKPPKGLRPAEWQALYPALKAIDSDAADMAEFLLASGWRWSEAAALDVFDVEDDGTTVHVTMGQVLRRNAAGEHVIVYDEAKSKAGLRRVKLDGSATAMVRRRIEGKTSGPVFTTAGGAKMHYSNFLNRAWNPAVKAANLGRKPTPHWLRHTSVAWLVMSGKTNLAEIQRRIGHEHISTTIDVYGRMIEDVNDDALDAFEAMRQVKQIEG